MNVYEKIAKFFKPLKTQADTEDVMEQSAISFYGLGALIIAVSLGSIFMGNHISLVSTGIIFIFNAYLIQKYHSRAGATILAVFTGWVTLTSILVVFGRHIGFANALFWIFPSTISYLAVKSTYKYHQFIKTKIDFNNAMAQTLLSLIYSVIFFIITGMGLLFSGLINKVSNSTNATLMVLILILGYGLTFKGLLPFSKDRSIIIPLRTSKKQAPFDTEVRDTGYNHLSSTGQPETN